MPRNFILWLVGLLVIVLGVLLWGKSAVVLCWDGLEVDEPLLGELCGISREEYFSPDFDPESCPEAVEAVYMVGGCETDWPTVMMFTAWAGGAYLLLSGIVYGFWRILKKPSKSGN